jgi:hypothetical protein
MARTSVYKIWGAMLRRCRTAKDTRYSQYGGRGIKVCERWQKFENFISDMGAFPGKGYSIERIDVNGDYEPSNCKWWPMARQGENTRKTIRFTPGTQFGFLIVLEGPIFNGKGNRHLCRCVCGTIRDFDSWRLKCGDTRSCGCMTYKLSGLAISKAWKRRKLNHAIAAPIGIQ